MDYIDFKSDVNLNIRDGFLDSNNNNLPEALKYAKYLTTEFNDFIQYCFDYFGGLIEEEKKRCAMGILAALDSLQNPYRYGNFNMSSMFSVHLCAGRLMKQHEIRGQVIDVSQIQRDVLAYLRSLSIPN